jgi:hypothetical protein
VIVTKGAQKRGVLMMANHWVLLKAAVAAAPWMTFFVVKVQRAGVFVINEEAVDDQCLWIDPQVLEVEPCLTNVFLGIHPCPLGLDLCHPVI